MRSYLTQKMVDTVVKYLLDISKLFAGAFLITQFLNGVSLDDDTIRYFGFGALATFFAALCLQRLSEYLDGID